jgi:probable phosphoglycerate mutase
VGALLIVRHDQSEWNALGRWQGHADPPLSHLGRRQAEHAADHLPPLGRVVSSDLQRAAETADIIARRWGVGPVERVGAIRERDVGPWQGLTHGEIEDGWPGYLAARQRPPGFESDEDLLARALPALVALGAAAEEAALVVTHGGLLGSLDNHYGVWSQRFANLGGRWFDLRNGELEPGDAVVLVDHEEVTRPEEL